MFPAVLSGGVLAGRLQVMPGGISAGRFRLQGRYPVGWLVLPVMTSPGRSCDEGKESGEVLGCLRIAGQLVPGPSEQLMPVSPFCFFVSILARAE